jgi:hypothetical protein
VLLAVPYAERYGFGFCAGFCLALIRNYGRSAFT